MSDFEGEGLEVVNFVFINTELGKLIEVFSWRELGVALLDEGKIAGDFFGVGC